MELELLQEMSKRDADPTYVGFSPDDSLLVSVGGEYEAGANQQGALRVRDVASGDIVHEFKNCVPAPAFLDGGSTLVAWQIPTPGFFSFKFTGPRNTLAFWDIESGSELKRVELAKLGNDFFWSKRNAMSFSPAGDRACCVSYDRQVVVIDVESGRLARCIEPPTLLSSRSSTVAHPWERAAVAVSPDAKLALWGEEGRFFLLSLGNGADRQAVEFPKLHKGWVNVAAFSPDGSRALTGAADGVRYWDLSTRTPIGQIMVGTQRVLASLKDHCPRCIAFSPGGNEALFGLPRGAVVFDLRTQQPVAEIDTRNAIECAAYSHNGRALATGAANGAICVWEVLIPDVGRKAPAPRQSLAVDSAREVANAPTPRTGNCFCPRCGEQNTALDDVGYRCGSCGAAGTIDDVAKLAATFSFRTGKRISIK